MFSLFGSSSATKPAKPNDEVERVLSASWYRSGPLYDLERRAIFSRKWLLVTHRLRFAKAGDYISFREAGFNFFLVKDQDGSINGFHNICSHRAYPVVTEESGSASILSCKYHGWSYGFKGNLAKAPQFDTVSGFEKSQHSLLSIHVHVDKLGFVWVNMDASEKPEISWETDFEGIETKEHLSVYNLEWDYQYDQQWSMDGDYNWKALADNYNECYHCPTSHPAVVKTLDLQNYTVDIKKSYIIHYGASKDQRKASIKPHFFSMQHCVPVSATKSKMECEVYRRKNSSYEEFHAIDGFFKTIMKEDKEHCNGAQKNLSGGVFVNGQLHPEKESSPIWFQETIREILISHREREEKENSGSPIWPATRKHMVTEKPITEEKFCAELEGIQYPGVLGTGEGILSW